jgi:hypothetical protein
VLGGGGERWGKLACCCGFFFFGFFFLPHEGERKRGKRGISLMCGRAKRGRRATTHRPWWET